MSMSLPPNGSYKQSAIEELKSFDWNDLTDFDSVGTWPAAVKVLLGIVVCAVCLFGGYWFHIKELQAELSNVTLAENGLKNDLETRAILASNLGAYKQQMKEMEDSFGVLLRKLPGETEVPGLIDDIYLAGGGSGSSISTLSLAEEHVREFYIELPIDIKMTGSYHDFGMFVSGVAGLSRIVTLHDFSIKIGESRNNLSMNINAKTYRYNDSNE